MSTAPSPEDSQPCGKQRPTKPSSRSRTDATCADGTEITPTIVADSLNYFADPETRNNFAKLVFGPERPTITADDAARTVTIDLAQPWSEVLRGLTLAQTGIICPAGLADLDGLAEGAVEGAFSGPWTLTDAQHGVPAVGGAAHLACCNVKQPLRR